MFLNNILSYLQKFNLYEKSFILQKIDWLIGANIILIILSSGFMQSDNIGYFGVFTILLTVIKLITKPEEKFVLSIADKFLLVYFLVVFISVGGSTLFALSLKGFFKTLVYLGYYVSLIHYLKDNKDAVKYILMAISSVVFVESIVALKQNFLSVSEISGWQDMSRLNPEEVMTRVYGTLKPYNPNLFGGYMLAALPATLFMVGKNNKTTIISVLLFVLGVISIVMTGCRGAYIGLFLEILLIGMFAYRLLKPQFKKLFLTITSFLGGIVVLLIFSITSLRARILSIFAMRSDSSNSFRFNVYNSCIDMFKDNWLLGIGCGNQNFREIYGLYMKTGFDALSAYNIYLETAVESGIFALIAFLAFVLANLYKAINYIFNSKNSDSILIIIAFVSISGMLIHGFVDTVFFRPQIQFIFWTMIGIIRVK